VTITPLRAVDEWIARAAIPLDESTVELASVEAWKSIERRMAQARVVVLGELNHFVHEKADFRLWWLAHLARCAARDDRKLVLGEELSWFDAATVSRYRRDGDERHLDRLWTFGYTGDARGDRDPSPNGVLAASAEVYPTALFKAEQIRFYRGLRALGVADLFGFDIGGHDSGYAVIAADEVGASGDALGRVPGESLEQEASRLERAAPDVRGGVAREALAAMIDSLRYTALADQADSYEALRPAMAWREDAMKRRLGHRLAALTPNEQLVLMAHAFHLAKDDAGIDGTGVGPGGGRVPSLGHHLVHELGCEPFAVWWLYGTGEDNQPFPDLPRSARFPDDSVNARLAMRTGPFIVPVDAGLEVRIGHLYNQVVPVRLDAEADVVFFTPRVTPLSDRVG
jgi:hypothetical protein